MIEYTSFNTAQTLEAMGYPAPAKVTAGQHWYNRLDGTPYQVIIADVTGIVFYPHTQQQYDIKRGIYEGNEQNFRAIFVYAPTFLEITCAIMPNETKGKQAAEAAAKKWMSHVKGN